MNAFEITHKIAIDYSGMLVAGCAIDGDLQKEIDDTVPADVIESMGDDYTVYEVALFDEHQEDIPEGWEEVYSGSEMGWLPENKAVAYAKK